MTNYQPANTAPTCPVCSKPRVQQYQPFCSKKCADVDLGRWFKGGYAIPTDEQPCSEPPEPPEPDQE